MSEAVELEDLETVAVHAIRAGATPREIERATEQRRAEPLVDPFVVLARETDVSLPVLAELQTRWGIE